VSSRPCRPASRAVGVLAACTAALLLLVGCSGGDDPEPAASGPNAPSVSAPPVPDALAPFYDQKLSWAGCRDGYQCAKLTVPVDYADPSGATIELSVIKLPAGKPKQRLGSLVVNPGGPGASGVDYARRAETSFSAAARRSFDRPSRGTDVERPGIEIGSAGQISELQHPYPAAPGLIMR